MSVTVYANVPEAPSEVQYVYDYANVLDDVAEEEMRQILKQIEEQTTNQVAFMTIDTIGDLEAYEFGLEVIRQWGLGKQVLITGCLFLRQRSREKA